MPPITSGKSESCQQQAEGAHHQGPCPFEGFQKPMPAQYRQPPDDGKEWRKNPAGPESLSGNQEGNGRDPKQGDDNHGRSSPSAPRRAPIPDVKCHARRLDQLKKKARNASEKSAPVFENLWKECRKKNARALKGTEQVESTRAVVLNGEPHHIAAKQDEINHKAQEHSDNPEDSWIVQGRCLGFRS